MNRGIFVSTSYPLHQLPQIDVHDGGIMRQTRERSNADNDRIERILSKSRSMGKVRPLDPDRPDLIARATRLSALYGSSRDSELARVGAGERPRRRRRQLRSPSEIKCKRSSGNCSPTGSSSREQRSTNKKTPLTRKMEMAQRSALEKAEEAAARYTLDASAGFKAFDGPPLTPQDVKDLLRRNVSIRLTTPEAIALIVHFAPYKSKPRRPEDVTIEHSVFLHAIQRLRRKLLKKRSERTAGKQTLPTLKKVSESMSSLPSATACLQQSIDGIDIVTRGKTQTSFDGASTQQSSLKIDSVVRALAKVDRAAAAYDRRRIESLRQADLSRATSPRVFGGVLLARFDVRVNPFELQELITLLQDESGAIEIEGFRKYFLSLIVDGNERCATDARERAVRGCVRDTDIEKTCVPTTLPLFVGSGKGARGQTTSKERIGEDSREEQAPGGSSGRGLGCRKVPVDARGDGHDDDHVRSENMARGESPLRLLGKDLSIAGSSSAPPWGQERQGGQRTPSKGIDMRAA